MLIRDGYRGLPLPAKLRAHLVLIRPFTLIAPVIAGLVGTIAPVEKITPDHVTTAMYVGVALALLQACSQVVNQVVDAELDKVVKPYRPIPSGLVGREEAMGIAWFLAIVGMATAFTAGLTFASLCCLLLFMGVFYSLPPFSPRKVNPFLNAAWVAVARGPLPLLAVWSVYGDVARAIPYSIAFLLWALAFQSSKDVDDVDGDRMFGIKTIPSCYGVRGLLIYTAALSCVYLAYVVVLGLHAYLLTSPLVALCLIGLRRRLGGLENNLAWTSYYSGLGLLYILTYVQVRLL